MKAREATGGVYLEYGSDAARAAGLSRAVEVPVRGPDQAGAGVGSVAAGEGMEARDVAGGVHLEYSPLVVRAALESRAVEGTTPRSRNLDETGGWVGTIAL